MKHYLSEQAITLNESIKQMRAKIDELKHQQAETTDPATKKKIRRMIKKETESLEQFLASTKTERQPLFLTADVKQILEEELLVSFLIKYHDRKQVYAELIEKNPEHLIRYYAEDIIESAEEYSLASELIELLNRVTGIEELINLFDQHIQKLEKDILNRTTYSLDNSTDPFSNLFEKTQLKIKSKFISKMKNISGYPVIKSYYQQNQIVDQIPEGYGYQLIDE